jgi:hypothetical protein
MVIGPCPSNLNPAWMERMFAAGLLPHVDAIESHGYADTGYAPEENDYPGKLAAIDAAMRKHKPCPWAGAGRLKCWISWVTARAPPSATVQ